MTISPYRKAVVSAALSALSVLGTAYLGGVPLTVTVWVGAGAAAIASLQVVFGVRNADVPAQSDAVKAAVQAQVELALAAVRGRGGSSPADVAGAQRALVDEQRTAARHAAPSDPFAVE